MHLVPTAPSHLAEILDQSSALKVSAAVDGEEAQAGRVYVCVPDRHLVLRGNLLRLVRSPKESHARPAVDVLFRSAAYSAGARVIGVVLTGQLDDGTAGLRAIKDRGGVAMVQDPQEAPFPSMPLSALTHIKVDHVARVDEMAGLLEQLSGETVQLLQAPAEQNKLAIENAIALGATIERGAPSLGSSSI
jgi:two-component system, chemotaxis family, protein-glutamate methylesterase/glutaminase